jgi:membrane-associated phospholipid phosphatase
MLMQALGATMAVTELAKTFAPRYRPFLAYPQAERGYVRRDSPDAAASFWSGHSAMAFAAATTGSIDACRGGGPLGCLGPALALHSLAVSTAAMRVLAGKHHVSDVIVGGAVGAAVATIVALVHAPKGREEGVDAMRTGLAAQAVSFSFTGIF